MTQNNLEAWDASLAGGLALVDGRRVSDLGPITKHGNRIIMADPGDDDGGLQFEMRAEYVAKVARQALKGRTATVYEGRVIDPLFGRPRRSVASLAQQFGVPEKRIYNIESEARDKIMRLIEQRAAKPLEKVSPRAAASLSIPLAPPSPKSLADLWHLSAVDRPRWLGFAKSIETYWTATYPAKQCPWRTFFQIWTERDTGSDFHGWTLRRFIPAHLSQNNFPSEGGKQVAAGA